MKKREKKPQNFHEILKRDVNFLFDAAQKTNNASN